MKVEGEREGKEKREEKRGKRKKGRWYEDGGIEPAAVFFFFGG